ncbi:MAG: DUF4097 family beta strand repeat-containing protein [bacterium]
MITRKTTIRFLVILLSFSFLSVVSAQELRQEGKYWVGEITKRFQVSDTGILIMDKIQGNVTIRSWTKKEVLIKEEKRMDIFSRNEAETAMEKSESGMRKEADRIIISGPGFDRSWIESRFEITLPEDFSCDIDSKGGSIDIAGLRGDVDASTGGGSVKLTDIESNVDVSTGGGSVSVKNVGGNIDVSTGGGSVTVLGSGKNVDISTGGGSVVVKGVTGDNVDISTGGGSITVSDSKGEFDLSTGGGSISIDHVTAEIDASTGGGGIEIDDIEGELDVSTGGGEIDLRRIKGAISASTGGGDVSAEVTLTDFSVNHTVQLSTGGGDIKLDIPAKLPAAIDAKIEYEMRHGREYKIDSDFPLKINEDESFGRKIIWGKGEINGGGDLIKLRTGGGDIIIKKR